MRLILLLLVLIVALGVLETAHHRRMWRRIPVRIHVNGSRGKSSVTRLIAAGLQAGGIRTCAKTTGSAAVFIHADGSETPVERFGPPNIKEQLGVFRRAVREGAEALVLECMAVRPDLQWICEHRIVHSTHGVLTNVRPDHLEVQGPRLEDVARSLAQTVPRGGEYFTAEQRFADRLAATARRRGSRFHGVDAAAVTEAELAPFAYVEFADNVALALAVCTAVGVPRETALRGMYGVTPDFGALVRWSVTTGGRRLEFVNAFAANDPESTLTIWRRLGLDAQPERAVVLLNNRADRMRRAHDLLPLLGREIRAARYVLAGELTGQLADRLRRRVPREQVVDLGGRPAAALWEALAAAAPPEAVVVGIGNIGGVGGELVELLAAAPDGAPREEVS